MSSADAGTKNCFFCVAGDTNSRRASNKFTKISIGSGPAASGSASRLAEDPKENEVLEATQGFHLFCHLLSIDPSPLGHVVKNQCLWACEACSAQLANLHNFIGVYNKVRLEIENCVGKIRGDICNKLSATDGEEEGAILPDGNEIEEITALNAFRREFGFQDDDDLAEINWNLLTKHVLMAQPGAKAKGLYPVVDYLLLPSGFGGNANDSVLIKDEPASPCPAASPAPMDYFNTKYDVDDDDQGQEPDEDKEEQGQEIGDVESSGSEFDPNPAPRRSQRRSKAKSRSRTTKTGSTGPPPGGPHECEHCGKIFTRSFGLNYHLRSVHGLGEPIERKFSCDDCGKTFVRKIHLVAHRQCHTGEKLYGCRYCEQKFQGSSGRKFHELSTHGFGPNGEQIEIPINKRRGPKPTKAETHPNFKAKTKTPVECPKCSKMFRHEYDLKRHDKLVHLKKESYNCEQCGALGKEEPVVFKSIYNLLKHQKEEHKGQTWKCKECGPDFAKEYSCYGKLKVHMKAKHGIGADEEEVEEAENEDMDLEDFPGDADGSIAEAETEVVPSNQPRTSRSNSKITAPTSDSDSGSDGEDQELGSESDKNSDDDFEPSTSSATSPSKRKRNSTKESRNRKSKIKKKVSCPQCSREFSLPHYLLEHIRNIHHRGYLQCEVPHCNLGLKDQEALDKHMFRHQQKAQRKSLIESGIVTPDKRGRIIVPPKPADQQTEADPNFEGKTETPVACTKCSKMFRHEYELKRHEKLVHLKKESYTCEQCVAQGMEEPLIFKSIYNLWKHQRLEHQGQIWKCRECGPDCTRTFSCYGKMKLHMKAKHGIGDEDEEVEEGENEDMDMDDFPGDADETIAGMGLEAPEIREDETLPPAKVPKERKRPAPPLKHKCSHCDKMFPWESDMLRHENFVHKNLKSFLCETCGSSFKKNFQLWHHMRNIHKNMDARKEPVECDQCPPGGKKYASIGWLEVHQRTYHGKDIPPRKKEYCYNKTSK